MKTKLGKRVGLCRGHAMLDGDPSPLPQRSTSPQFSAHIYCCKMAGWIKMPLGMEAGLGPSHIVLYGDPASPQKRGTVSNCRPMSVVAKRLDGSRCHLVRRYASAQATLCYMGTQLTPEKTAQLLPIFGDVYCGKTVAHLSYC